MWRLVLTVSLLCWSSEGRVTCRNNTSGEVDWFILYKEPKPQGETKTSTGLEYVYIDSNGMTMTPSTHGYKNIKDSKGVLANTLRPLFTPMPPNFGFISYSDQPPGSGPASDRFGHSKGVVMVEKDKTGVWLLHSTPKFPNRRNMTLWPDSGEKNAQMFICVTFPYKEFKQIGKHLQYIGAFPFDSQVPRSFHRELRDAADRVQSPPPKMFQELRSEKGQIFRSFAKQQSDEPGVGDLYVTIANAVRSDVFVQTWNCRKEPSYCVPPFVLNIKSIGTDLGTWNKCDHSKWCVAKDQSTPWSCVADVNRAKTQFRRRGGALCIENKHVQKIFLESVKDFEGCSTLAQE